MRVGLVRDPRLAHDGLLIATFCDEMGIGDRPGRSGEQAACAYWLEHRLGPPGRSTSDIEPVIGRSLSTVDIEGTVQAIGTAIERALPLSWRACTAVAAGWRVSVTGLRDGPWLERAGLPTELPMGLTRWTLQRRVAQLRREFVGCGLIERAGAEAMDAIESEGGVTAMSLDQRDMVRTWDVIGALFNVTGKTAQRWHTANPMPVYQSGPSGEVWAYRAELAEWQAERMAIRMSNVPICPDMS